MGGTEDPENGPEVAATIFVAVFIYAVSPLLQEDVFTRTETGFGRTVVLTGSLPFQGFFVFCGLQGLLHLRESRRGAIAL